ncbi:MAG: CRISPR-associated protein Cas4 [Anaerolineales bacterium]|nr:CRISPR-associated protein Cas4 [Anaerolineales bacterium]
MAGILDIPDQEITTPWRVTDLKQYVYCPRVLYYQFCLPDVRPVTYKMKAGVDAGERTEALERRRSLRNYGFTSGVRHFDYPLVSEKLGMRGKVDMVIETDCKGSACFYPVDFKLSKKVNLNIKLQIAAYALMLEEERGIDVKHGFIYLIPLKKAQTIKINAGLRDVFYNALDEMNAILYKEIMPPPARSKAKCIACEFRRFCNDV